MRPASFDCQDCILDRATSRKRSDLELSGEVRGVDEDFRRLLWEDARNPERVVSLGIGTSLGSQRLSCFMSLHPQNSSTFHPARFSG